MVNGGIYNKIKNYINTKGELPKDFKLEEETKVNGIPFAPGALEGILSHHSANNGGKSNFPEKLKSYMSISADNALEDFETNVAANFKTAAEGKTILKYVIEHQSDFPPNKLFPMAFYFAANGTKVETVKIGLNLMQLFDNTGNLDQVYPLLLNLGYCDEFAGYVFDNTLFWSEAKREDFIFQLAKKLKGWGKINAVEMLKAETAEIQKWILCHGCQNSIIYNYLAMTCAVKSKLYDRLLQGNLSEEEFNGATDIVAGLIEEGPCASLADMEEGFGFTIAYINEVKNHTLDIKLLDLLYGIKNFYEFRNLDNSERISAAIGDISKDLDLEQMLKDNMSENPYICIRIANATGIDLTKELYSFMEKDFNKYFFCAPYFLMKKQMVDEFFALCDERIDESNYPKGMGQELGLGKLGDNILSLDMVVQYLDRFPMKGKKLIKICLNSPIVRWRNMAVKSLNGWKDALGKGISDIDKELYELAVEIHGKECDGKLKERLSKLI